MYCIESGQKQQCSDCRLIEGRLFAKDGYMFPNCDNTQWVAVHSLPGTNNTPVYQVVPLPLDSALLVGFMAIVGFTIIKRKIK